MYLIQIDGAQTCSRMCMCIEFPIQLRPHWRRSSFTVSFCSRMFVCPNLSLRTEGVFRCSFSLRAQNIIPERGSTEGNRAEARRGFLILRHESGPEFHRKPARILSRILSRDRPEFFSPFFPATKESTPNPRDRRGETPRQFWKLILSGFSGSSTLACVVAFGC